MLLSSWSQRPFGELEELPPSLVASLPSQPAACLLPSPRVSRENSPGVHAIDGA